jgi:peptide/nickel transport system substrate-binding protein
MRAPQVTEIIYTPIKEAATRVAALLSGEVDFVQDVPVQDIERLSNTPGVAVTAGAENRTIFFAYDVTSDSLISLPGTTRSKNPKCVKRWHLRLTATRSARW